MSAPLTRYEAEDLLYREALLIDTQRFAEWLELFTSEVEFWMPAWLTNCPNTPRLVVPVWICGPAWMHL